MAYALLLQTDTFHVWEREVEEVVMVAVVVHLTTQMIHILVTDITHTVEALIEVLYPLTPFTVELTSQEPMYLLNRGMHPEEA
jgi:hypothetical protein